jgi:nicotinamidase-related amidase
MTTLEKRPNTALIVIDVQAGVVTGNYHRDEVVQNVAALVERARAEQVPVVWVQDEAEDRTVGSDAWQIVAETTLESVLSDLGVGRLVVAGAQTDACIRSTLHGALARGYDATLVSDAHTTEDLSAWGAPSPDQVIAHTNLYWGFQTAPGRVAGTVATADVRFSDLRPS